MPSSLKRAVSTDRGNPRVSTHSVDLPTKQGQQPLGCRRRWCAPCAAAITDAAATTAAAARGSACGGCPVQAGGRGQGLVAVTGGAHPCPDRKFDALKPLAMHMCLQDPGAGGCKRARSSSGHRRQQEQTHDKLAAHPSQRGGEAPRASLPQGRAHSTHRTASRGTRHCRGTVQRAG